MITEPQAARAFVDDITKAPPLPFDQLIAKAKLDPACHLRLSDWAETDFSGCDLRGFDFSMANISRCNFAGALIENARFDGAIVDIACPRGRLDPQRTNLRTARDWSACVGAWRRVFSPPSDHHLQVGAIFQDAPFAPEMVVVPDGAFWMGSPDGSGGDQGNVAEPGRQEDEGPRHCVTITRRFAVGRFVVTFEEWDLAQEHPDWRRLSGLKPRRPFDSKWGRGRRPVVDVSWNDAQGYCRWLSAVTGKPYRLPRETEWEYCCRAGATTAYATGDTIGQGEAKFYPAEGTAEVGSYPANAWGLHDMHGNVWEWCHDVWRDGYMPNDGPEGQGGAEGGRRVLRGGSWNRNPQLLRSALRNRSNSANRNRYFGFRIVRSLTP
ncbi:MAG TPA: SUMF1/EgtB/PvdO family nonheme iron enzyme [Hyphomicrobiaceae bacterium]|jgi:formylglycine-generating enzyme required for sulfatase activity|nr:SUMF1/EgtB/PvdO family nonheme iron enzyme [Hyphomicrobiaceae bacterium]